MTNFFETLPAKPGGKQNELKTYDIYLPELGGVTLKDNTYINFPSTVESSSVLYTVMGLNKDDINHDVHGLTAMHKLDDFSLKFLNIKSITIKMFLQKIKSVIVDPKTVQFNFAVRDKHLVLAGAFRGSKVTYNRPGVISYMHLKKKCEDSLNIVMRRKAVNIGGTEPVGGPSDCWLKLLKAFNHCTATYLMSKEKTALDQMHTGWLKRIGYNGDVTKPQTLQFIMNLIANNPWKDQWYLKFTWTDKGELHLDDCTNFKPTETSNCKKTSDGLSAYKSYVNAAALAEYGVPLLVTTMAESILTNGHPITASMENFFCSSPVMAVDELVIMFMNRLNLSPSTLVGNEQWLETLAKDMRIDPKQLQNSGLERMVRDSVNRLTNMSSSNNAKVYVLPMDCKEGIVNDLVTAYGAKTFVRGDGGAKPHPFHHASRVGAQRYIVSMFPKNTIMFDIGGNFNLHGADGDRHVHSIFKTSSPDDASRYITQSVAVVKRNAGRVKFSDTKLTAEQSIYIDRSMSNDNPYWCNNDTSGCKHKPLTGFSFAMSVDTLFHVPIEELAKFYASHSVMKATHALTVPEKFFSETSGTLMHDEGIWEIVGDELTLKFYEESLPYTQSVKHLKTLLTQNFYIFGNLVIHSKVTGYKGAHQFIEHYVLDRSQLDNLYSKFILWHNHNADQVQVLIPRIISGASTTLLKREVTKQEMVTLNFKFYDKLLNRMLNPCDWQALCSYASSLGSRSYVKSSGSTSAWDLDSKAIRDHCLVAYWSNNKMMAAMRPLVQSAEENVREPGFLAQLWKSVKNFLVETATEFDPTTNKMLQDFISTHSETNLHILNVLAGMTRQVDSLNMKAQLQASHKVIETLGLVIPGETLCKAPNVDEWRAAVELSNSYDAGDMLCVNDKAMWKSGTCGVNASCHHNHDMAHSHLFVSANQVPVAECNCCGVLSNVGHDGLCFLCGEHSLTYRNATCNHVSSVAIQTGESLCSCCGHSSTNPMCNECDKSSNFSLSSISKADMDRSNRILFGSVAEVTIEEIKEKTAKWSKGVQNAAPQAPEPMKPTKLESKTVVSNYKMPVVEDVTEPETKPIIPVSTASEVLINDKKLQKSMFGNNLDIEEKTFPVPNLVTKVHATVAEHGSAKGEGQCGVSSLAQVLQIEERKISQFLKDSYNHDDWLNAEELLSVAMVYGRNLLVIDTQASYYIQMVTGGGYKTILNMSTMGGDNHWVPARATIDSTFSGKVMEPLNDVHRTLCSLVSDPMQWPSLGPMIIKSENDVLEEVVSGSGQLVKGDANVLQFSNEKSEKASSYVITRGNVEIHYGPTGFGKTTGMLKMNDGVAVITPNINTCENAYSYIGEKKMIMRAGGIWKPEQNSISKLPKNSNLICTTNAALSAIEGNNPLLLKLLSSRRIVIDEFHVFDKSVAAVASHFSGTKLTIMSATLPDVNISPITRFPVVTKIMAMPEIYKMINSRDTQDNYAIITSGAAAAEQEANHKHESVVHSGKPLHAALRKSKIVASETFTIGVTPQHTNTVVDLGIRKRPDVVYPQKKKNKPLDCMQLNKQPYDVWDMMQSRGRIGRIKPGTFVGPLPVLSNRMSTMDQILSAKYTKLIDAKAANFVNNLRDEDLRLVEQEINKVKTNVSLDSSLVMEDMLTWVQVYQEAIKLRNNWKDIEIHPGEITRRNMTSHMIETLCLGKLAGNLICVFGGGFGPHEKKHLNYLTRNDRGMFNYIKTKPVDWSPNENANLAPVIEAHYYNVLVSSLNAMITGANNDHKFSSKSARSLGGVVRLTYVNGKLSQMPPKTMKADDLVAILKEGSTELTITKYKLLGNMQGNGVIFFSTFSSNHVFASLNKVDNLMITQQEVRDVLACSTVIKGGPGTGKTTLMRSMLSGNDQVVTKQAAMLNNNNWVLPTQVASNDILGIDELGMFDLHDISLISLDNKKLVFTGDLDQLTSESENLMNDDRMGLSQLVRLLSNAEKIDLVETHRLNLQTTVLLNKLGYNITRSNNNKSTGEIKLVRYDPNDLLTMQEQLLEYVDYTVVTPTNDMSSKLSNKFESAPVMTLARSQGSEWNTTIFVLTERDTEQLNRSQIYVALTRHKLNCVVCVPNSAYDNEGLVSLLEHSSRSGHNSLKNLCSFDPRPTVATVCETLGLPISRLLQSNLNLSCLSRCEIFHEDFCSALYNKVRNGVDAEHLCLSTFVDEVVSTTNSQSPLFNKTTTFIEIVNWAIMEKKMPMRTTPPVYLVYNNKVCMVYKVDTTMTSLLMSYSVNLNQDPVASNSPVLYVEPALCQSYLPDIVIKIIGWIKQLLRTLNLTDQELKPTELQSWIATGVAMSCWDDTDVYLTASELTKELNIKCEYNALLLRNNHNITFGRDSDCSLNIFPACDGAGKISEVYGHIVYDDGTREHFIYERPMMEYFKVQRSLDERAGNYGLIEVLLTLTQASCENVASQYLDQVISGVLELKSKTMTLIDYLQNMAIELMEAIGVDSQVVVYQVSQTVKMIANAIMKTNNPVKDKLEFEIEDSFSTTEGADDEIVMMVDNDMINIEAGMLEEGNYCALDISKTKLIEMLQHVEGNKMTFGMNVFSVRQYTKHSYMLSMDNNLLGLIYLNQEKPVVKLSDAIQPDEFKIKLNQIISKCGSADKVSSVLFSIMRKMLMYVEFKMCVLSMLLETYTGNVSYLTTDITKPFDTVVDNIYDRALMKKINNAKFKRVSLSNGSGFVLSNRENGKIYLCFIVRTGATGTVETSVNAYIRDGYGARAHELILEHLDKNWKTNSRPGSLSGLRGLGINLDAKSLQGMDLERWRPIISQALQRNPLSSIFGLSGESSYNAYKWDVEYDKALTNLGNTLVNNNKPNRITVCIPSGHGKTTTRNMLEKKLPGVHTLDVDQCVEQARVLMIHGFANKMEHYRSKVNEYYSSRDTSTGFHVCLSHHPSVAMPGSKVYVLINTKANVSVDRYWSEDNVESLLNSGRTILYANGYDDVGDMVIKLLFQQSDFAITHNESSIEIDNIDCLGGTDFFRDPGPDNVVRLPNEGRIGYDDGRLGMGQQRTYKGKRHGELCRPTMHAMWSSTLNAISTRLHGIQNLRTENHTFEQLMDKMSVWLVPEHRELMREMSDEQIHITTTMIEDWLTSKGGKLEILDNMSKQVAESALATNPTLATAHFKTENLLKEEVNDLIDQVGRVIVWNNQNINMLICPVINECKYRLKRLLNSDLVTYSDGMSVQDINVKLATMKEPKNYVEMDLSKQDRQTDKELISFEWKLMEKLGLKPEIVMYMEEQLRGFSYKTPERVTGSRPAMRWTGGAMTSLGNEIRNLLLLADVCENKRIQHVFTLGDDSLILSDDEFDVNTVGVIAATKHNVSCTFEQRKTHGVFLQLIVGPSLDGMLTCSHNFARLHEKLTYSPYPKSSDDWKMKFASFLMMIGRNTVTEKKLLKLGLKGFPSLGSTMADRLNLNAVHNGMSVEEVITLMMDICNVDCFPEEEIITNMTIILKPNQLKYGHVEKQNFKELVNQQYQMLIEAV